MSADAVPVAAVVAVALCGWTLTIWQASGMGGMTAAELAVPAFLLMWVGMMVAMMGPTIVPLVRAHLLVVRKQGRASSDTVALVAGYFAIWFAIGLLPAALFAFVQRGYPGLPIAFRFIAATVLVLAGLYQFTDLKSACLRACRSPLSFLMTHDFGAGAPGAFGSGLAHGLYCLGCCWALMVVLGVVGFMNLAWMAALSLLFFLEKNWRFGASLSRAAGAAVAGLGVLVGIVPGLLGAIS